MGLTLTQNLAGVSDQLIRSAEELFALDSDKSAELIRYAAAVTKIRVEITSGVKYKEHEAEFSIDYENNGYVITCSSCALNQSISFYDSAVFACFRHETESNG